MLYDKYLVVAIFAIIGLLFPTLTFFGTRFFRPEKPTVRKLQTYECGEIPEGDARIQFHFQYYIFGIIFVIFDITVVFLLSWALIYSELSTLSIYIMGIFISILLVGLFYVLKKEEVIWI